MLKTLKTKTKTKTLSEYTDEELNTELRRRQAEKRKNGDNGWFYVDADMVKTRNDGDEDADYITLDEITIECADWVWLDVEGHIRRTYGFAGGSCLRMHTFDASGMCVQGQEARDVLIETSEHWQEADLYDRDGIYPVVRKLAEQMPIEDD